MTRKQPDGQLVYPLQYRKNAPNKGGRPRKWDQKRIKAETKSLQDWVKEESNYFLTGWLADRGLQTIHIDRFCQYDEEFRMAFFNALMVQEKRLVHLAITRKGDPGFIKFVLQNKAGWKEKSEVSGDAQNPLAVVLQKIADNCREPVICEAEVVEPQQDGTSDKNSS